MPSTTKAPEPDLAGPFSGPTLTRRAVLAGSAAAAATVALTADPADAARRYFHHGVASGDPYPHSVVIWTRVTPSKRATPGSGAGARVAVKWQIATDRKFRNIVKKGTFSTGPGRDHTVKLAPTGLKPSTWYWFRFIYKGERSPVGRTRTAPASGSDPSNLRFGMVSCSNLQAGHFHAYRHLAARTDLHAVVHLGDYLYEYAPGEYGYSNKNIDVRPHQPAKEMVTLADYRQRHAQYKQDPDLAKLHRQVPFIVTWDDHESTNDAWREGAGNHQEGEGDWATRLAAAQRAYDEWMPVRMNGTAKLDRGRLYRRIGFGNLAEITMLDLRSYRSEQSTPLVGNSETLTGRAQMDYLKQSLSESRAQWKLIGNPVMIAPVRFPALPTSMLEHLNELTGFLPPEGLAYNVDQWDGYTRDRREVLSHLADRGVTNTVFLTGDIHSSWVCELPVDAGSYPLMRDTVGTEFVCTSVTSNNLKDILGSPRRTISVGVEGAIKVLNPHIKTINFDDHGYCVVDVTARRTQVDYFITGDRRERLASSTWVDSWATTANTHTVHNVRKPVA